MDSSEIIVYGLLLLVFFIGLIATLVGGLMGSLAVKWDFPLDELLLLKKESLKQCIKSGITLILLPLLSFPLRLLLDKRILLTNFIVLFICMPFSFMFVARLMRHILLYKEVDKRK
jgi:hypothetical protein